MSDSSQRSPSSSERSSSTSADEIDLTQIVALIKDSWKQIAAVTFVALVLGVLYALFATPIYRADALLQVEARQSGLPVVGELTEMLQQESSALTEIELVRSRMVIGNAVDELNLDLVVRPQPSHFFEWLLGVDEADNILMFSGWADGERQLWLDTFQVPNRLKGESFTLTVTGPQKVRLEYDGERVLEGAVGVLLQSADQMITLMVKELDAPEQTQFELLQRSRTAVIQELQKELAVSERGRNTGILTLSLQGAHPQKTKVILDSIASSYYRQNVQRRSEEAEKSLEFLDQQVPEIKAELDDAENRLNAYRLQAESVDLSLETKAVLDQLVVLESQLSELQLKEAEVGRLFTREHPAYRTLLVQRENFEREKTRLEAEVKNLPETQQEVLRLTRDVQINQEIYLQLLNRVQELRIVKAGTVGNVRIIDPAEVGARPVKPKKQLVVALAALLGLMLGLGIVFVRAAFNRGIENAEQLEQEGIPVYASLPLSEEQRKIDQLNEKVRRRKQSGKVLPPSQLLAVNNPGELTIEALRSLRTSLHFAMMEAPNKLVMVSGPSPTVGKSFVSANFAVVLAQAGQRVLLIDGDMRKGHLHRYFANSDAAGLSGYLSGRAAINEIILETEANGLHFMPRGQVPPNPAELLMHPRFEQLIAELEPYYDLILIDTPPILAVTDAAIVGKQAGTTLLVARYAQNTVKEITQTIARFEQNGVSVKGVVLNAVERTARNAYYYYYYSYK